MPTEKSSFVEFQSGFMLEYVGGKNHTQGITLPSKRMKRSSKI
jgi:hypothetical protein